MTAKTPEIGLVAILLVAAGLEGMTEKCCSLFLKAWLHSLVVRTLFLYCPYAQMVRMHSVCSVHPTLQFDAGPILLYVSKGVVQNVPNSIPRMTTAA